MAHDSPDKRSRTPGAYILLFHLPRRDALTIGRLGSYDLAPGHYAYVGSAMGGLEARVGRHMKGARKKHWHIDHLMELALDLSAYLVPSDVDIECGIAEMIVGLPGATMPIRGFGSSDCRCRSHLFKLDAEATEVLRSRMSERGAARIVKDVVPGHRGKGN